MAAPLSPAPTRFADARIPFRDLDDDATFRTSFEDLAGAQTKNFVVEFSAQKAGVAFDLQASQWEELLSAQKHAPHEPRWFNFFAPNQQMNAIKAVARHYDFSPRLLALMCSDPDPPQRAPIPPTESVRPSRIAGYFRRSDDGAKSPASSMHDEEKASEPPLPSPDPTIQDDLLDLNHYKLVDELWHYTSVDTGRKYLCLGFNTLHGGAKVDPHDIDTKLETRILPKGKRLWSWLTLCEDGTVISMYEDPFPSRQGQSLSTKQLALLPLIRRNLINVFRQLSKAQSAATTPNPLLILHLRRSIDLGEGGLSESTGDFVASNGPSLLFYYLFDDWYSSYGLVTRKEQQYGAALNQLRQEMLESAELDYVNRLHRVGRELTVLKRMYQSYYYTIKNVLDGQKERESAINGVPNPYFLDEGGLIGSNVDHSKLSPSPEDSGMLHPSASIYIKDKKSAFGPAITPEAIARFERLRGRIQSYALSEIQDCLDEKESMAFMNFNLIAMKESRAVEHLTRITILLGKLTIIFLPVSLLTELFGAELPGMNRTQTAYWTSFGIIMGISILFVIIFGLVSGTLESKIIYRSLGGRAVEWIVKQFRKTRSKKPDAKKT